jgi:hypothetical protein
MAKKQSEREENIVAEVIGFYQESQTNRGNWDTHWQEVAQRYWPMQERLFLGQKDSGMEGEKRTEFIFDSTPVIALNRFGAIVDSLLTPRNQTWHRLVPTDESLRNDREVMLWFEQVNRILFKLRYAPKANFASQNQMTYKMLGAYGNSAMFIDQLRDGSDKKLQGFRYRNVHMCEIWFGENHQGIVDTVVRQIRMTPRQIMQAFSDVPEEVRKKAEGGKNDPLHVLHRVCPRRDADPSRTDAKSKPYASYYVLQGMRYLLEEGGYDCMPYAISRYEQTPNEVYGRSPAMDALPAVKTLNEQKKAMLKQGHRALDPVLLVHDDGILDNFSLLPGRLNPGGVSAQGQPLVHALPVGNVQAGKEMMDDEKEVIKSGLLVDLFQILEESPEQTATEVMERVKEKGMLLTPILGRQESEYLGPLVERELSLGFAMNLFPPVPPALQQAGGEYHLEYDSPLSRAQKAEEAAGYMRTLENAIGVAQQTQDPSILDHFDFDTIIPAVAYINGMPSKWLKDPKQIQQARQARSAQMQQEQAIRQAPGQAAMIKATANAHEKAPDVAEQITGVSPRQ